MDIKLRNSQSKRSMPLRQNRIANSKNHVDNGFQGEYNKRTDSKAAPDPINPELLTDTQLFVRAVPALTRNLLKAFGCEERQNMTRTPAKTAIRVDARRTDK